MHCMPADTRTTSDAVNLYTLSNMYTCPVVRFRIYLLTYVLSPVHSLSRVPSCWHFITALLRLAVMSFYYYINIFHSDFSALSVFSVLCLLLISLAN